MTRSELINHAIESTSRRCAVFPLNKCKACIYWNENGEYVLRSYNTIVAIAKYAEGKILVSVFDYYSNTTNTTHISKFREWLRSRYCLRYNDVIQSNLYRDSGMSKRKFESLSSDNWETVIGNVYD